MWKKTSKKLYYSPKSQMNQ